MSKPARSFPRPLSEFLGATLGGVMKAQGFASTEIIARWADIVGRGNRRPQRADENQLAAAEKRHRR